MWLSTVPASQPRLVLWRVYMVSSAGRLIYADTPCRSFCDSCGSSAEDISGGSIRASMCNYIVHAYLRKMAEQCLVRSTFHSGSVHSVVSIHPTNLACKRCTDAPRILILLQSTTIQVASSTNRRLRVGLLLTFDITPQLI